MSLLLYVLAAFELVGSVTAVPDPDDPYDLSFLTKGAGIGDSYAAGIGAGNQVDWGCSRYDGSYANLVAQQLGTEIDALDFTYTACSGAVISGVIDQANKLSGGQQFVIVSAGGNDADLVGILNSCVYSFWGGLSHPSCDNKLESSRSIIQGSKFASDVDVLISNVQSKLASGGNIYYVGYAKFFDTTDQGCDNVSWHIWLNLFTREYLTQARRQSMNDLVDLMNGALRDRVARAGPQVHFIDYDDYVGLTIGRYCQPGTDENSGNSANRQYLFFYEMKSIDSPWTVIENDWSPDELKRRGNTLNDDGDLEPANSTLNAIFGAFIQEAIEDDDNVAALQDDNANMDLDEEVQDEEAGEVTRREVPEPEPLPVKLTSTPRFLALRGLNGTSNSVHSWNITGPAPSNGTVLGSTISLSFPMSHSNSSLGNSSHAIFAPNGTNATNSSSIGTVVSNSTHVILANGNIVKKVNLKKLIISDKTSRVFHPTQNGHALIANMILYQMAVDNAQAQGIDSVPAVEAFSSGETWPQIGGAACNNDSSDTWSGRDQMISAVKSFCSDPHNLKGSVGKTTGGTYNPNTLDYMSVSINWNQDVNLGEHSCGAWLDVVTDGCDVPDASGLNAENLKHGGTIQYQSNVVDAILSIDPLVVRRIWDKGVATGQLCNDVGNYNYLDQGTLQKNIDDFCAKSAAQPNGIANAGSVFSQIYNDGTPDRVVLKTQWPNVLRNYQIFQEECEYYMGVLNNGCNLPGETNPMNWKHGGSMLDRNGIEYTITPTQDRPAPPSSPQGACNADAHWWGYSWDVWGGGFENSDFGSNLQSQVKGCGAVTAWKFDYYDTASGVLEWHASGTLPLFISSHCLAKAVRSAGGYESNC